MKAIALITLALIGFASAAQADAEKECVNAQKPTMGAALQEVGCMGKHNLGILHIRDSNYTRDYIDGAYRGYQDIEHPTSQDRQMFANIQRIREMQQQYYPRYLKSVYISWECNDKLQFMFLAVDSDCKAVAPPVFCTKALCPQLPVRGGRDW